MRQSESYTQFPLKSNTILSYLHTLRCDERREMYYLSLDFFPMDTHLSKIMSEFMQNV